MTIKVTTSEREGMTYATKVHEDGKAIYVVDGHLMLSSDPYNPVGGDSVAIYAPEAWRSGEVIKDQDPQ